MIRPGWLAAPVFALAATVAGLPVALGQSPSAGSPRSPGPQLPASPSDAPSPMPRGAGPVVAITDGPGFTGAVAYDIAVAPDGAAVMVGERPGKDPNKPVGAMAWRSVDGTAWTELQLPRAARAHASKVAVSAMGWVVVGFTATDGLIWTSPDGVAWTRAKPLKGAQLSSVIATDTGFLVGGQVSRKGRLVPTLWQSSDLATWATVRLPGKATGYLITLARNDAGVVMVLEIVDSTGYRYLRSTDGATFTTAAFPVTSPDNEHYVAAGELGVVAGAFVQATNAGATGGAPTGTIWTSVDGITWQDAYTAPGALFAVAGGRTGDVFGTGAQVSSVDGVTWLRTARPEITTTLGAATLPDGTSLVLSNSFAQPPVVTLLQVPAIPGPVPSPQPSSPVTSQAPAASLLASS